MNIKIQDITGDAGLQMLLKSLDSNGDGAIDSLEVDRDKDGYLDYSDTIVAITLPQKVILLQECLLKVALISKSYTTQLTLKPPLKNVTEEVAKLTADSKRILFIRQIHDRPEHDKQQKTLAAEYQYEILKELISLRPKHIFLEALFEDYPVQREANLQDFFKSIFSLDKMNQEASPFQLETLNDYSAADIYYYLADDVSIHKTQTQAESDFVEDRVKANDPKIWNILLDQREAWTIREINDFFMQHAEEKEVVLIYGAKHCFGDDVKKLPNTALISTSFPELIIKYEILAQKPIIKYRKLEPELDKPTSGTLQFDDVDSTVHVVNFEDPVSVGKYLKSNRDPQAQLEAIKKAKAIQEFDFQHITSEEGQLKALDKLTYDNVPFFKEMGWDLKTMLMKNVSSDRVKKKIAEKLKEIKW